jgi:hypothetical protein
MNIQYTELFREKAQGLPAEIKKALRAKLELMIENPRHPSSRAKKNLGQVGIFEDSVTMSVRMTRQYTEDGILLRNIGEHDQPLKKP